MLDAPTTRYAMKGKGGGAGSQAPLPEAAAPRRVSGSPSLRRDLSDEFTTPSEEEAAFSRRARRAGGLRFRLGGGIPRSVAGRVVAGGVLLVALGSVTGTLWAARSLLLHDARLTIPSSASIQITGNNHLTRAQLLSVFGEDVDRNILTVSLADRRAQLERLPWVEHATVMRLLPNRVRVAIVERTPVAFVRQGGQIGLVDANGVLLDMDSDGERAEPAQYSFPVVTGIATDEPISTRTARMKLYADFTAQLDAGKEKVSKSLSEVDLSSPEDVKALIPSGSSDILVHFGNDDFLRRYQRYQERLPEWKAQYPKLASVDMRYERQVVLEMAPGTAVPVEEAKPVVAEVKVPAAAGKRPSGVKAPVKGVPDKSGHPLQGHAGAKAPVRFGGGNGDPKGSPSHREAAASQHGAASFQQKAAPSHREIAPSEHLQTAFDVHAKPAATTSHPTPQAVPR